MDFAEFAEQWVFFKGPLDEIFEGNIIDFIVKHSIEGITTKDQASNFIIRFDGELSHGVIIERLLSKRISFGELSNEFCSLVD